MMTSVFD